MKYCKLKTGTDDAFIIEKSAFETKTKQDYPYYTAGEHNEQRQFAVCPACDNPIQIIGLYKKLKNTDKPYGKHYMGDVKGLAYYNEQAYRYCPYSNNKITVNANSRKEKLTELEKSIYYSLRNNFDRVVYILSKELDIWITPSAARKMLSTFVKGQGWLYPWATLTNIPFVFAHLTWNKSLFAQPILKGTDLYYAIQGCDNVAFEHLDFLPDYERLKAADNRFIDICYCVINHKRQLENDELTETMELVVTDNISRKDIYIKQIVVTESRLFDITSKAKNYRNNNLLQIAKELMPDI